MRALTALLAAALILPGCAPIRARQGYLPDYTLVTAIQPGIDNRTSVERTLGRPTFVGQFDNNDWYYLSRATQQVAFRNPRPTDQLLLHVRFDARGNVTEVKDLGLQYAEYIRPSGDKTPTLGRKRTFFQDLFGGIGQVGAAGPGGATADNPGGP